MEGHQAAGGSWSATTPTAYDGADQTGRAEGAALLRARRPDMGDAGHFG